MTYLLAIHKVADFTQWKKGYEASLAVRQEAGLKERYLLRSTDDPNEVVVLHEVEDLQKAQAFTQSAGLRERMQQSGVQGEPTGYFLTDAGAGSPAGEPKGQTAPKGLTFKAHSSIFGRGVGRSGLGGIRPKRSYRTPPYPAARPVKRRFDVAPANRRPCPGRPV